MRAVLTEERRRYVVLAWSVHDVERDSNQESIVIPIAPGGFLAATRSSGAKVIDTDRIMGAAEDMADVIQVAIVAV